MKARYLSIMRTEAFNEDVLGTIFRFDDDQPDRLISRESGKLEFKESFNFASIDAYSKTAAAFANSQGGYIVFGVRDQPREAVGLKGSNFVNLDVAKLTQALNDRFSPEIAWEAYVYHLGDKIFGLLHFSEATSKPVVCTRNGADLKESDIYYRYRGQSQRIKYPELRAMLEAQAAKERSLWMHYLQRMAKIGIQNVAVLDTLSGELSAQGNVFLIPETLIPKLNFVKSGFFTEDAGGPALMLLGNANAIASEMVQPEVKVPSSIGEADIIRVFLDRATVLSPIEYLRRICSEKSFNLPVYFFVNQLEISREEVINDLESVTARGKNKAALVSRLSSVETADKFRMGSLTANSVAAAEHRSYIEKLKLKKIMPEDLAGNISRFCEAVTHLEAADTPSDYLADLMKSHVMTKFQQLSAPELTAFRKCICYLDILWDSK
jgi:hypothetical protein